MSLHRAIRAAMAWEGISIKDMAARIGVDRHTLGKRLAGHSDFSATEISEIAKTLGLSAADLMRRAEEAEAGEAA